MQIDKPTYRIDEAARRLGISRRDLLRLCRNKRIGHIHMCATHKDVRFRHEELERFLRGECSTIAHVGDFGA